MKSFTRRLSPPGRRTTASAGLPSVSNDLGMKLPFLRKAARTGEPLIVAMTGARLGDAILFAGRSAALALPLAARAGLSGRFLAIGEPEAAAALESAAQREGVLIETASRTPPDGTFELAVVEATGGWPAAVASARLAVRRGGRVVVVAGAPREGLLARLTATSSTAPSPEEVVRVLAAEGWHLARVVGEGDGMAFIEAFA